ncbi:MAG: formylmethanofuran dehydrogenase subunit C [Planctomyces sp.]|nr:formylmethanofuran dehydrogenase subunit C [Planctomyces sp.]
MALEICCQLETTIPIEIEGLTPDWTHDKTLSEIERFEVFHGNRRMPLAEIFKVTGDPADQTIRFTGLMQSVHWIGAHMKSGSIEVIGDTGRHVGSQMSNGRIEVHGSTGGWTGSEMKGGFIHVHGNAGHLTGSAYRGSSKGMKGGTILVDGNAGNEVGLSMRRGLIAIGGNAGDMTGFNMIAGSILIFGECGIRPGAGMRRGTIALFGANQPPLLPTFRHGAVLKSEMLRIILRTIETQGMKVDPTYADALYESWHGDQVSSVGRGEILRRRVVAA